MTIFVASNTTQLTNDLSAAHGGDTIELAAGTYSGLGTLSGYNYSSAVTITSQNTSSQAVLSPFGLNGDSNITFSHLTFNAAGSTASYAYTVRSSSGITFDHDTFHGNVGSASVIQSEPSFGIGAWNNTNLSVTNSDFSYLFGGLSFGSDNGTTITNNSFHELESDGVDLAPAINANVSNNVFTDFHPSASDHPDAIQMWGAGSQNVTVDGNLYVRGAGSTAQGIFLDDNAGWLNGATIDHNIIVGGAYNGIMVTGADNLTISNNTVAPYSDQQSWIRIQNDSTVHLINNTSYSYVIDSSNTNLSQSGDVTTGTYTTDNGAALINLWVSEHPGWTGTLPASIEALVTQPSSPPPPPVKNPPPPSTGGGTGSTGGPFHNPWHHHSFF